MVNATDYMRWLCKEYDFRWETSGRLVSRGVIGYTNDRELGFFKDCISVLDRLAPLLSDTDFLDRWYKFFPC